MSSVREKNHWFKVEHKLNRVHDSWDEIVDEEDADYFSFDGKLRGDIEKSCNTGLALIGPILETYIKELGVLILNKLSLGRATGLSRAGPLLIPWQIMVQFMRLVQGYGGVISPKTKKGTKGEGILHRVYRRML